jgi:lysophospholipase L1-like esterase
VKAPTPIRCLFSTLIFLLATVLPAATVQASPEIWAKEIDRLTATDVTNPPPAGGVVFVGSSSIRLWTTLAKDFPDIATINRGFGGSELADSVFYADRIVIPYRPRLVVLFAGTNDLKNGKTPEAVLTDFKAFRAKLHSALPDTRLIYLAITFAPSRTHIHEQMRATNRLIALDIATDPRCTFVDINPSMTNPDGLLPDSLFVEDRLHLNREGYAIWAKVLAPYLKP